MSGRKKRKKEKLKFIIKAIIIGIVLAVKLLLFLKVVATKVKVGYLLVAFGYFLLNALKLFFEIKKGKHPQKIIYYEHAEHHHDYDHEHHDDGEVILDHPPEDGYWHRNYGGDGDDYAQNLAYSAHNPYKVHYSKPTESSVFSWLG